MATENQKPSQVMLPWIPWIYAQSPSYAEAGSDEDDEKDRLAKIKFKELTDSGERVTAADIKRIAKEVKYVSGKWLIYKYPQNIDATWETIAKATRENKLGIACKVSTAGQALLSPSKTHVICVYTKDYTDESDVRRVEEGLRQIGVEGRMHYKPDIYTILDIYAKNRWKIKATVYSSVNGGASSYKPAGSQVASGNQSNPYFPKTTYLSFDQANVEAILAKLREFNENLPEGVRVDEASLASLANINTGNLTPAHLNIVSSLLKWPQDVVFPCLDVLRLIIKLPVANEHFFKDPSFLKLLLGEMSVPNLKASNQMLILRTLVNSFKQTPGEKALLENRMAVLTSTSSLGASSNKNVQIALASLVLNYSVAYRTSNDMDAKSECLQAISQLQHVITDPEAHFRLLVGLGTLVSDSEESQALAKSLELHAYPKRTLEIKEPLKVAEISKLVLNILS